ncbi:MAG: 8-oxo-dGTP diphosphatase MutT [Deltaproteobacteria bacterium]|nr:MAG: 8-oxo-dGTP diphosphatase MutT [Deltaproteobacteria bacterium]
MRKNSSKRHFNVAAGIIWKGGKLLITKRPEGGHLSGFWEFPGGKQEGNESLTQCLEREIREELGISIKPSRLLLTVNHEYGSKQVSLHFFECSLLSGQPQVLQCAEIRWVRPEELHLYHMPPPDQKIIPLLLS